MLEWGTPWWFLALPVAIAAPWLARQPRAAVASLRALRTRRTLRATLAFTPKALGSLGLALLVVALARPQEVNRERVIQRDGIDIMLVLDTSGSMEARDYELGRRRASRLQAAKQVIGAFVQGRPDDRIGLVVFGEEAFTQVPLTTDGRAMVALLSQVDIGLAGKRATAVGDAIAIAGQRLKDLEAPERIVILLTDGQSNAGQVEPMVAAEAMAALGIKVYTIGIGGGGGGGGSGLFGLLNTSRNELDERTLQAIAQTTGAQYFRADDTQALSKVYETIDQLEKTTAEVKEFVEIEERYAPWLWAGLAALLAQLLLGETLFRRLP
jgi:Ca-activated chloride channel family protein